MYSVQNYTPEHFQLWNSFVDKAINATFLFKKDFMEYHQHRFTDASCLLFKEKKLIALFPANRVENKVFSHQGLSYGGLVVSRNTKSKDVVEAFKSLLVHFEEQKVQTLEIKMLPKIYHQSPCDALDYVLFKLNAERWRCDTLSVIQPKKIKLSRDRSNGVKRARKHQLVIKEEADFSVFWNEILVPNLSKKHGVKPVHSLEEITMLKERFPQHIRQFNVYHNNKIVAGTTIFESVQVAHSQYISANETKNELGSLDLLHQNLLTGVFKDKPYFDFGSSNETNGQHINAGLQYWKEGFGARTIVQEFYRLKTKNYHQLSTIFI